MRKVGNGFGRVLMVVVALAVALGLACTSMTSAWAEGGGATVSIRCR